MNDVTHTVN